MPERASSTSTIQKRTLTPPQSVSAGVVGQLRPRTLRPGGAVERRRHPGPVRTADPALMRMVDAEGARAQLVKLTALGWSLPQIATLCAISPATLTQLPAALLIDAATEAALRRFRVDFTRLDPHDSVPARSTRRRLNALAVMAWSTTFLADHLGVSAGQLSAWGRADAVPAWVAAAISELYRRLAMRMGPCAYTRRRALQRGLVGPLEWDERSIEDLHRNTLEEDIEGLEDIDPIAIERAIAGEHVRLNAAEANRVLRLMAADGASDKRIADALGVHHSTILRRRTAQHIEAGANQPYRRLT